MRNRILTLSATLLFATAAAFCQSQFQVLHSFTGGSDGGGLWGSVALDQRGNAYGVAFAGGAYSGGLVFELVSQSNGTWSENVLYSFCAQYLCSDGAAPFAGPTVDATGNVYGTTQVGGTSDAGTVFQLTSGPTGWVETVIHDVGRTDPTGALSGDLLVRDGDVLGVGNSAFELSDRGSGWRESILHTFTGQNGDGYFPQAGPIVDGQGNLYGTTRGGGGSPTCPFYLGCGTVWELQSTAEGPGIWRERILYRFGYTTNDGHYPSLGQLAMDGRGNLYGSAIQGGSNTCVDVGCGTIFKLTRIPSAPGGRWVETILYNFKSDTSGSGPGGGVVIDSAGNLYGTTLYGGSPLCGCGVVYELSPQPNGSWQYTLLHTFQGSDGAEPDANLTLDPDGNLYGTTATGGLYGGGVVFQIQLPH